MEEDLGLWCSDCGEYSVIRTMAGDVGEWHYLCESCQAEWIGVRGWNDYKRDKF
jgi:predicted RNA-binding Zn-ribbon protein involved in translation (DUF1610 family)